MICLTVVSHAWNILPSFIAKSLSVASSKHSLFLELFIHIFNYTFYYRYLTIMLLILVSHERFYTLCQPSFTSSLFITAFTVFLLNIYIK